METNVAEDSANVALMQGGRADFQVGGVPSRLTLESAGFKPVLTSADLAQYAEASTDSAELRAVFHDGWLATDEWLEANHDTALRMASVGFRINAFIASNPEDAMAIHTPFLNSVAGTDFDNSIAAVAYESLHPFLPFDEQEAWHLDPENPLNGEYVIGSAIKLYEEQGVFQPDQHQWSDFSIAHEIYQELVDYRDRASGIIEELESCGSERHRRRSPGRSAAELRDLQLPRRLPVCRGGAGGRVADGNDDRAADVQAPNARSITSRFIWGLLGVVLAAAVWQLSPPVSAPTGCLRWK